MKYDKSVNSIQNEIDKWQRTEMRTLKQSWQAVSDLVKPITISLNTTSKQAQGFQRVAQYPPKSPHTSPYKDPLTDPYVKTHQE